MFNFSFFFMFSEFRCKDVCGRNYWNFGIKVLVHFPVFFCCWCALLGFHLGRIRFVSRMVYRGGFYYYYFFIFVSYAARTLAIFFKTVTSNISIGIHNHLSIPSATVNPRTLKQFMRVKEEPIYCWKTEFCVSVKRNLYSGIEGLFLFEYRLQYRYSSVRFYRVFPSSLQENARPVTELDKHSFLRSPLQFTFTSRPCFP